MSPTWIHWFAWGTAGVFAAAGAAMLVAGLFRDRSRGRRRCPKCWYDMAALPGLRCPECGGEAAEERRLLRTRRHARPVVLGLLLLIAAWVSPRLPRAVRDPWSILPMPVLLLMLRIHDDDAESVYSRASGLAKPGDGLTTWEKLLLARACARKLRERVGVLEADVTSRFRVNSFGSATGWSLDASMAQAMWVLGQLGEQARPGVPVLVELARGRDPIVRRQAVEALGAIGPVTEEVRDVLLACLEDRDRAVVATALSAIVASGDRITIPVDRITGIIRGQPDAASRRAIIRTIARGGPKALRASPALEAIARTDDELFVKMAALEVLRKLLPADRVRELLHQLLEVPDYTTRAAAARMLQRSKPIQSGDLAAITRAVRESPGRLGATGADVLSSFGAAGVPYLGSLAADPDHDVAAPAIWELGMLGARASPAVGQLVTALSNPEERVRLYAINALRRIGPSAASALPHLEEIERSGEPVLRPPARHAIDAIEARW